MFLILEYDYSNRTENDGEEYHEGSMTLVGGIRIQWEEWGHIESEEDFFNIAKEQYNEYKRNHNSKL